VSAPPAEQPPSGAKGGPRGPGRGQELVAFALDALPAMRLDDGAFCREVVAPGPQPRGRSLRYSLIVLLGLLRAEAAGVSPTVAPVELKALLLRELDAPSLSPGDLGLALWADARSGLEAPAAALDRLEAALERGGGLGALAGFEVSWILIGCVAVVAADCPDPRAERLLLTALERQLARLETASGLFLHADKGWRARFPNFATQIYGVWALAEAARLRGDPRARAAARRAADALCALQRPDGGWPWIFDARRGRVVEPYELYSVHQDAMAPIALDALSQLTGERSYEDAARRGMAWIWGGNDLGVEMLDREAGLLHRSIRRRRPLDRLALYANTVTAAIARPALACFRGPLELNATDRPYHLGWVLEAWCGRAQE
jgi:hypothetical protein